MTKQKRTVVITGASSGIGRATALLFAREKANVVLAARREHVLNELALEIEKLGAQALVVPTDVTDKQAVEELARKAYEKFGKIDVWVSNAGVYMLAPFEKTPYEDIKRLMDVNFMGVVHGAMAVLPYFRREGEGVLINTGSMLSRLTGPYYSVYAASKHAVEGFATSLRQDLMLDPSAKKIKVATVMPASIDTPLFKHTANYTGRKVKAMTPVYPPEKVAKMIMKMSKKGNGSVFVGGVSRLYRIQQLTARGLTERLMAKATDKQHFYQDKAADVTPGNLYEPMVEGNNTYGGWGSKPAKPRRVALTGMAVALVPLGLLWWRSRQNRPKSLMNKVFR